MKPGSGAVREGTKRYALTLRRVVLLLIASALAMQSYLLLTYSQDFRSKRQRPIAHFQGMINGDDSKPFVARVVVPFVVRTAGNLVPQERAEDFVTPLRRLGFHFPQKLSPPRKGHIDLRYYGVWMYLAIASLTLLGEGIYRVLRHYYDGPPILFEATAVASLILWPALIAYSSFMIDAFTPMIVVWTMLMAIKRRWPAYYLLLLLAAFHKETMVAIPMAVCYLYYYQRPWRRFLPVVALQIAGVLAIRIYLSFVVFGANEGTFVQFHLFDHNLSLDVLRTFLPTLVLILALVLGLVLKDFSHKPRGCKALAITVLPLLVFGALFGYLDEIRQYAEAYPGLVCLAFPTLVGALKSDLIHLRAESAP
jgi:hypothetical protein